MPCSYCESQPEMLDEENQAEIETDAVVTPICLQTESKAALHNPYLHLYDLSCIHRVRRTWATKDREYTKWQWRGVDSFLMQCSTPLREGPCIVAARRRLPYSPRPLSVQNHPPRISELFYLITLSLLNLDTPWYFPTRHSR
jgi:hypothetical protein